VEIEEISHSKEDLIGLSISWLRIVICKAIKKAEGEGKGVLPTVGF
jgi:hypothetical protein